MAELLKGAPVAAALNDRTAACVEQLKQSGITPTLAILRLGQRQDDVAYEIGATKRCEKVGVSVRLVTLDADVSQDVLLEHIAALNSDEGVHGILMFRPLPKHIDESVVCDAISPSKDVDGITSGSMAGVYAGTGTGFPPCTPSACMEILDYYGIELKGKKVVMVGRSLVVGKPAAMMLLGKHATVTVCHTRTKDMPAVCREADVLLVAAGRANVVDASYLSPGQVVLDVGINISEDGSMCGDVFFAQAEPIVSSITPVPGGVGTVTTSVLVNHVVQAAQKLLT
jgi:methylenetetrahydrofolate dehydrogenase (NADP+)/methenyltetrahydrofolate cyclohydrolase